MSAVVSLDSGLVSHAWRLPRLDSAGVRRLRLYLAAWATAGRGNSRSWRMATLIGGGEVRVIVGMPKEDVGTIDVLDLVLRTLRPQE